MKLEGPISRFAENILVANIIGQYLTIPKELNSLLRVSKRFHRLVLNDGTTQNYYIFSTVLGNHSYFFSWKQFIYIQK